MTGVSDEARLGQFFTPRGVVEFALDALAAFGAEIESARVIDPACGPGEWLQAALERGATEVVGMDCDPAMAAVWRDSGLAAAPPCRLLVTDALLAGARCGRFDLVVGNPPFGAELRASDEGLRCIAAEHHLHLGARGPRTPREPSAAEIDRLRRFPTELLFLERFVTLCRPGGWIAVVLPEGLLANTRWRYVRQWLLGVLTVHAVVALPRATFRAHATTARTCLLLMRNTPAPPDHRVALAEVDECSRSELNALLESLAAGETVADHLPEGLLPPPLLRDGSAE
ncbi:MAG: N-6 DNA methylase [Armatimonadota bacterium]|nr:N-6 DNA methylase [Armatimonadota bacterium]